MKETIHSSQIPKDESTQAPKPAPVPKRVAAERCVTLSQRYSNEVLLLHGRHQSLSGHQSIVFFSMMKAASTYVGGLLRMLVLDEHMTPINLDGYKWSGGLSRKDIRLMGSQMCASVYKEKGYFYGPFRTLEWGIPQLDRFKVLLMLRDPRDVLVSFYFSMAFSHPIPEGPYEGPNGPKWVREKRVKALAMSIDEFVLSESDTFFSWYRPYCDELLGKGNVLFVTYEEMVADFEKWLRRIIRFLDLHPSEETVKEIVATTDFNVTENQFSHKRQVRPGDHTRKLKTETVRQLTEMWRPILEKLSYAEERIA